MPATVKTKQKLCRALGANRETYRMLDVAMRGADGMLRAEEHDDKFEAAV